MLAARAASNQYAKSHIPRSNRLGSAQTGAEESGSVPPWKINKLAVTFLEDDFSGLGPFFTAIALHNCQALLNTPGIMWHFFQGMGWQNLVCLVFAAILIRIGIVGGEFRGLHTREPIPERQGRFWAFVTAALFLAFGLFVRRWH